MRSISLPGPSSQAEKLKTDRFEPLSLPGCVLPRRRTPKKEPSPISSPVWGVHPATDVTSFAPSSVELVAGIQEKALVREVLQRSESRPGATIAPADRRTGTAAPLVPSSKSHPYLPPWKYVPTSPVWSYQVFTKDVYVCRYFPATPPPENTPSPRAAIYEFSDKSRAHLDHVCCNSGHLIRSQLCLTYHNQNPTDGEVCKRHLDKWLKSLRRRLPGVSYLWVLEFQLRGVPHFHVFLSVEPNPELQKKMARSWVRITKTQTDDENAGKKQYWWHCRPENWIKWSMDNGVYVMKEYAIKHAQKDVPKEFQNVGRFWGCSRSMSPKPTHYGAEEVANLTRKTAVPWEPAAVRHYMDKVLRRWQERQMNYDRQGNRRRNPATGKVNPWKNASMIRHESELSGCFKIKNGAKVFERLLNYIATSPPDRYSIAKAIAERVPF